MSDPTGFTDPRFTKVNIYIHTLSFEWCKKSYVSFLEKCLDIYTYKNIYRKCMYIPKKLYKIRNVIDVIFE